MQSGIRKTRCNGGHGTIPKTKASRLSRKQLVFFSILFVSVLSGCSGFKKTNSDKKTSLENKTLSSLDQLCLNSSGKGRIKFLSEKHLFNYESLLDSNLEMFSLGVEIPFKGEEIFEIIFKEALNGKYSLKGKFIARLIHAAKEDKKSKYYLKLLRGFMNKYTLLLKIKNSFDLGIKHEDLSYSCKSDRKIDSSSRETKCQIVTKSGVSDIVWMLEKGALSVKMPVDKNHHLDISMSDLKAGKFRKVLSTLKNPRKYGANSNLLELSLFLTQCDANKIP